MFIIADNITFKHKHIGEALREERTDIIQDLAQRCAQAGAQALEINIGPGKAGNSEMLVKAVRAVQEVVDLQLCLSTADPEAMESGIRACKRPPVINYFAAETDRLERILPLAAKYNCEIIALVAGNVVPIDAEQSMMLASVLVGAANQAGIPNDRLLLDPGVMHIGAELGQRHTAAVIEVIRAIPSTFDPPVRTVCWLGNVSSTSPEGLRPVIDSAFLAMLAGAGVSAVFMDVLDTELRRPVQLIKAFQNEIVYADALIERGNV
ncbi:MAG: dihydropteroate synthase [Chloroflexi bacterium]|nr:dihydropteroate synthase [Chloroflexota bacterium]